MTGIPLNTLENYHRGSEPCYRNGLMIVELTEGVPRPRMVQVDWFAVICELKRMGISTYRVSQETAIPQSTLIGYKGGAEPKFSDGEILVEYYRAVTGKGLGEVPSKPLEVSAGKAK